MLCHMKWLWRKVTKPFRVTAIVVESLLAARRRAIEAGIPFSHAWLIVVDEKNAQLDANVQEIEQRLEETERELQEVTHTLEEKERKAEEDGP